MNDRAKVAAAVIILGMAGGIAAYSFRQRPASDAAVMDLVSWYHCFNSKCLHEWSMTEREARAACAERRLSHPPCPSCSGIDVDVWYKCERCTKLNEPEGVDSAPRICPKCGFEPATGNTHNPPPKPRGHGHSHDHG